MNIQRLELLLLRREIRRQPTARSSAQHWTKHHNMRRKGPGKRERKSHTEIHKQGLKRGKALGWSGG